MVSTYTRRNAILLLLAKRQVEVGVLTRALAEWNEELHPRDDHGRFGPGGGGPSGDDFVMSPSEALGEIANGYHATVSANDVREVLDKAADNAGPIDLTNLTIDGTPIFAGGLNRTRDTMPQIPKEHQKAFLKDLNDKGIGVREDTVRPSQLLPTQNEIDAVRVGQKLREYDSGNKDLRAIMVSKDNYVLDGHHRWAVMATLDVESPKLNIKMPVIRIMQDHSKALNSMLRYTRAHGISNRALEFNEGQHPRDDKGQWTSDGSGGLSKEAAIEQVDKLFSGSNVRTSSVYGKWVPNPLTTESEAIIDARWKDYDTRQPFENPQVKEVPISQIDFPEERIYKELLQKKLETRAETDGAAFENNGRYYLRDGNHRIVAEYLKGNTTVRLKVVQAERTAGKKWSQEKQRFLAIHPRETRVHRAADAHLNPVTVAVMYAFLKARKVLKADPKNVTGAMKVLRTALGESLPAALLACLVAGGEAAVLPQTRAAELRTAAGPIKLRFDRKNPAAAKWAREHAAELIDGISETTEERIREAIALGQEGEVDVYDEVLDAVGDEARASVIARTESMRAANEGQRQMWDQAVDDGLLTGDERREWIVAEDACPLCDELDGELADLDGEYPGDGGDGPPLHPNCRCTEGISAR